MISVTIFVAVQCLGNVNECRDVYAFLQLLHAGGHVLVMFPGYFGRMCGSGTACQMQSSLLTILLTLAQPPDRGIGQTLTLLIIIHVLETNCVWNRSVGAEKHIRGSQISRPIKFFPNGVLRLTDSHTSITQARQTLGSLGSNFEIL